MAAYSNRKSTPLWREFELLVSRIEQVLACKGVQVTSPDRIRSLITGRMREVDASLRFRVDNSDIVTTVECRKRSAKQDVTWIEQLWAKKLAIGATRTIAVASSGFTKDAIKVAEHYGIDLRILSKIDDADLRSWILPNFVIFMYQQSDLLEPPMIELLEVQGDNFTSNPPITCITEEAYSDSAIFKGLDGSMLSLKEVWVRAESQLKFYENIPQDNEAHVRHVAIELSDELTVRTNVGWRQVQCINMTLSMRWKFERIESSTANIVSYKPTNELNSMQPQVRAEFNSQEANSANLRFGMQFQPGKDKVSFSVELIPGKQ